MVHKIAKLSQSVINQIAAGEVVESPSSIVKELIENSLDAGAKRIDVEVTSGGQELIRVEDDGCGMGKEDALLSLERYATSKINSVDDLQSLVTMGFRGEALAAISSVCHFEMRTSDGTGSRLVSEGGKVIRVEPCARNRGTTIEVRSLFYNVPARKKFQKSKTASMAAISRLIETVAIAHPEIAFSLNAREFAPCKIEGRIEEILGPHEHEVNGEGLVGYLAAPNKAMAMRTGQYLYLNKRPIFSPLIAKAVKEAFGTRIGEHMYPRFVLFLEMSPEQFDVNVHPQKKEVRFCNESALFRRVQEGVEKALSPKQVFLDSLTFTQFEPLSFSEKFSSLPYKMEDQTFNWVVAEKPLALLGKFLLLEKEGLFLIDLRAAHARVLFDAFQIKEQRAQTLMWPVEIPLSPGEEERVIELEKLGIECRILKKMLIIDALPPFLEPADFPKFYSEWRGGKKIEEIATKFCHSRQRPFSFEEAIALWKEVQKCENQLYDPMGHLIFSQLKEEDLGRVLMRK